MSKCSINRSASALQSPSLAPSSAWMTASSRHVPLGFLWFLSTMQCSDIFQFFPVKFSSFFFFLQAYVIFHSMFVSIILCFFSIILQWNNIFHTWCLPPCPSPVNSSRSFGRLFKAVLTRQNANTMNHHFSVTKSQSRNPWEERKGDEIWHWVTSKSKRTSESRLALSLKTSWAPAWLLAGWCINLGDHL